MNKEPLTPTEKLIFEHLKKWQGQIIPYHEFWSIGAQSEKLSLAVMMSNIRSKTNADITNLRGKGYIFYGFKKAVPSTRPTCGPRCKTCGKVLYHYDKKRGECFTHAQERHIEFWNQPVKATAAPAAEV